MLLTARDGIRDRVLGLECGADDYLVKPFAFPELVARLKALHRRSPLEGKARTFAVGPLELHPATRRAALHGDALNLTPREFDLLDVLARFADEVVSRDRLARLGLHIGDREAGNDNLLDVHISRLRRKLEQSGAGVTVRTVRGLGFVLEVGP